MLLDILLHGKVRSSLDGYFIASDSFRMHDTGLRPPPPPAIKRIIVKSNTDS